MKKIYIKSFHLYFFALSAALYLLPFNTAAQKLEDKVSVSVTVSDEDGNPVPGAEFTVGEGLMHLIADDEGRIQFYTSPKNLITVSSDGYIDVTVLAGAIADSKSITLSSDTLLAGEKDMVPLPNNMITSKRYSLGNTIVISGEELMKYPSTDIRNAITAIASGVEVTENFGGPGLSPLEHINDYGSAYKVSITTRGRQMMYMVDDVPVMLDETPLDPEQIESVTIVRDALEKNIYGPSAANGIVYIRTKRGKYNDRYLNVNVEGGLSVAGNIPEYVNGEDYARLNNIARKNSGLDALYTEEDINAYAQGNPNDMFHPNIDFRSMMLKNTSYYTRAGISSGGGNDNLKYYAYLGYSGEDDLYKMGAQSDYNRVNINANLDIKLHRYVKANFGIISTLALRRSPNYGYGDLGVMEFSDVLDDINRIPAISFPIYASNEPNLEFPWYAVSTLYTDNPIANLTENGSYSETIRKGFMNVGLNVDFSFLLRGLKSFTYAAYDVTNLVRLGMQTDYAAYILTPGYDTDWNEIMIPEKSASHSVKEAAEKSKLLDYFSNRFYLMQNLTYDRSFGKHNISAYASYMITKRSQKFISEHRREMNFGLGASYSYAGKYLFQFTSNCHGTYSLLNKWSFSPTAGFGWIVSEEDFMSGVNGIDFLKLRIQGGMINYDSSTSANRDVDNYKWDSSGQKFGPHDNNQWFGSSVSESVDRLYPYMLGNPNLRLERRYELTAGIDLVSLDNRLSASLNYYRTLSDGPIAELENVIPGVAGVSSGSLWMNYDQTLYQGYEVSLGWKDRLGDFSYAINGWASGNFSKILRTDQLNYRDSYRSKVGYPTTAIWGLKCIGQFASDEETQEIPQIFDDELVAGDLKYQDMNGDGMIDDNDNCVIGNTAPKVIYGLNLNFRYRDFDLTVNATGRAFYDVVLNSEYFWNGWGDSNYSKYVLDNVDNPNHPRLTYNKVNNNYKTSTFWLDKGGFFKIQAVELGYELPVRRWNTDVFRKIRVYLRGSNLCTLTGIKYVDPESFDAGTVNYPLMSTFVAGFKLTF